MFKILLHENLRAGGAADYTFSIIQFYDTPRQPPKLYRLYTAHKPAAFVNLHKKQEFSTLFFYTQNGKKLLKSY